MRIFVNKITKKTKQICNNPYKIIYLPGISRMCTLLGDAKYIKLMFRALTGSKLNLNNPTTFNEKLQWLKLYDRRSIYTEMVDKFKVKRFVANIIGEDYIIPTLGVWDKFDEIDLSKLPDRFVLKTTHDSGGIVICRNKSNFDTKIAKKKINRSLRRNYYFSGREWPYKGVQPRIIAEKYMADKSEGLNDYKVYNFNGEPRLIQVDFDRFSNHKRNIYTTKWEYVPVEIEYPTDPNHVIEKPAVLEEMLELSRKLARDIPFLRTDFYIVKGKIYFGELTLYHGNGTEHIVPNSFNVEMGEWLELPR